MKKRKTIACILVRPEEAYQKRVMEGLQAQCEVYGYNLAVFSPLVGATHYYKDYLDGEMNILNLPNFSKFDAVVIISLPLFNLNDDSFLIEYINSIKKKTDIPVISLDYEIEGCICSHTDDITPFYRITQHVIETHQCKKIYMLTGHENNNVSERRLKGFINAMTEHGLEANEKNIFYGDFWYTSGEQLAGRILSGELEFPEAVICAADHMAIGLVNKLEKAGIRIPEQIIVTGYEATIESMVNNTSITSYIPDISLMAANAINKIKDIIEPERPLLAAEFKEYTGIFVGESCGCYVDSHVQKKHLQSALYHTNRNYGDTDLSNIDDISSLLENYMLENITQTNTPFECLSRIFSSLYLISPFDRFTLCLRPNWIDTECELKEGYTDKMRRVIDNIQHEIGSKDCGDSYCRDMESDEFDTEIVLPELWEESEKPLVFYFAPCHFSDNTLGYAVLQCFLERRSKLTVVFHNWIRTVNTGLEMIRTKNKLFSSSVMDSMTKLYNRRGMNLKMSEFLNSCNPDDKFLAMVMDMDGLKYVNDTFGHNEGDYALTTIASVVRCMAFGSEIAARAGGDEFYIIGTGDYKEKDIEERIEKFYTILGGMNKNADKPYEITASVGYSLMPVAEISDISKIIASADSMMYECKKQRKNKKKK